MGIGTVEGHGLGASGNPEDEFSTVVAFRHALDIGKYMRVGVLRPGDCQDNTMRPFTFRTTASGRRAVAKAEKLGLMNELWLAAAYELAGGARYVKRGTGNNELT